MTHQDSKVKWHSFVGLFLVTLATLMYEITLTRIFSVTMWYHFAFMAISVTMFGMTVGAIMVYLLPKYFVQEKTKYHLSLYAFLFALSMVICFLAHLTTPLQINQFRADSLISWFSIAYSYLLIALPFVFSGICVTLALTKFPRQVSQLYAADLAGAAVGCILLVYTLNLTDGPTAVIVVACLGCVGSLFFVFDAGSKRLRTAAIAAALILAAFSIFNTFLVHRQATLLPLTWVKGKLESRSIYEKWNSFSRIKVWGDLNAKRNPFGWGISSTYSKKDKIRMLHMDIDAGAYTPILSFSGDLSELTHLKYDITNLVHYVRPDARVLVVGTGGGRDILSALVFKQKQVVGVEINNDIIDVVNKRFAAFTGNLHLHPRVTFVNDEARSYIERQKRRFDIIQVSMIDTWAATASGAYVLTENSLYTVEAWKSFLDHLSPGGVLTFSRYYFRDGPGAMYRLTSLAAAALLQSGITEPREHIYIARNMGKKGGDIGIGTILVANKPFSPEYLHKIDQVVKELKFEPVLTPNFSLDPIFSSIASAEDVERLAAELPINIAAPTDDSPFFFHLLRFSSLFDKSARARTSIPHTLKALYILGALLIIVVGLSLIFIIGPLALTIKQYTFKGAAPLFLFFSSIGMGFMFVEISQLQRLIIFLGHPTYSLTVVLFSLLLSSGIGSFFTRKVALPEMRMSAVLRLLILLLVLVIFGSLTPHFINIFKASSNPVRILVSTGVLFPLGFFMGMAFPLGMKLASLRSASLTPWLWGINGAMSVCASVFALIIAIAIGISASFWTGFFFYILAAAAFSIKVYRQ